MASDRPRLERVCACCGRLYVPGGDLCCSDCGAKARTRQATIDQLGVGLQEGS